MKKINSEKANLAFFGNFVEAMTRLEDLAAFLKEINKFIEETHKRLESLNNSYIKKHYEHHEFTLLSAGYEVSFGEILRKSFIVTLVIILELEIGTYCDEFKDQLHLKIGWKDFRGAALDRFKIFIDKLIGIKLSISNNTWKDLHSIVAIRNCLVHADGCLKNFSEANEIIDFSRRYSSLEIQYDFVQISLRTCEYCLGIVLDFIEAIYGDALLFFPGSYGPKRTSNN